MRAAVLFVSFLAFLLSAGCGGGRNQQISKLPQRTPIGLRFEKEISGRILAYDLRHPGGVAVDAQRNLYITDTDNHRIIKFDRDYQPQRDYGGYGSGVGKFLSPEDIIVDRGLNIYVLDAGSRRIVHLDTRLNFVEEIFPEDDPEEIMSNRGKLSGLQISPLGELTVADYDNSRLIRMDNFFRFSRYIGDFGYGRGSLLNPLGLAGDKRGRSYVADAGNGRVAVYDDYGNYLHQLGREHLEFPSALAISPDGAIWVADTQLRSLFVFSPAGTLQHQIAESEMKGWDLSGIEAMVISFDDRLYLADSRNNRVMVYSIVYEDSR